MKKIHKCFVIMPFSDTRHGTPPNEHFITRKQWDHIYDRWIKRAVESYAATSYACTRSAARPGNFIKGIIADIASANLLIADLTGGRPNVYYELGIRHALRTGSIIITQHLNGLPSDLGSYFACEYTYSEKDFEYEGLFRTFASSLHRTIGALEESEDPSDSPVSDFLGLRHQLLERTAAEEKGEFRWLLAAIGEALAHNYQVCEEMYDSIIRKRDVEFTVFPVIDLFPLEVLYTRLFSTPWAILRPKNLSALAELLTMERRKLAMYQRLFDQAALGAHDDNVLAGAFATMSKTIVGGRKRLEKQWRKILDARLDMKLVWEHGYRHRRGPRSART
jgi:hypothetical protein